VSGESEEKEGGLGGEEGGGGEEGASARTGREWGSIGTEGGVSGNKRNEMSSTKKAEEEGHG
jgi:hypothetical protein